MRPFLYAAVIASLLGGSPCLAQVSTMGTTAMGIPSTPGAIVSSPLTGPSPFSAATLPGALDTTLAPVPLALDPTTPGTSLNCSASSGQATAPASPTSMSVTSSPMMPSTSPALGTIGAPGVASTSGTAPLISGPTTISVSNNGSATGTIAPITPLGSSTPTGACTSSSAGSSTNSATLPLSTPEIPASPPLGTIQPDITELGSTSIDPTLPVVPTPNSAACSEAVTMTLANPGMMAPANATGAAATPGVSSPSGC